VFATYGISADECTGVVQSLKRRPKDWVDFMMRFELGLEKPDPQRAWKSALTIALSYVIGGLIPIFAYIFIPDAHDALRISIIATLLALALFGGIKGKFTGVPIFKSGIQTALIGGLAAAAAFGIARLVA
jgi:VIT1/CCC1 family predicted Fe2+/Mn2+ transporter